MKKTYRVKSDKDFQAIFSKGTSVANRKFVVYQLEKNSRPLSCRAFCKQKTLVMLLPEIASSEKLRHVVMELSPNLRHHDFVIIARKGVEELDYHEVKKNFTPCFKTCQFISGRSK